MPPPPRTSPDQDPRSERERVVAWRRRRQDGLITRQQALAAGWSSSSVSDLVRRGAWERWQRGVYAPAGLPRTFDARLTAGLLALGGRGVVIGITAARLWRLPDTDDARGIELAVTRRARPSLDDGVVVRGYPWLRDALVHRIGRRPTLTPADTIADLCARWPEDRVLDAAADLVRRRAAFEAHDLLVVLDRRGRFRGASRLRRVAKRLDPAFARTRSVAEIRALRHLLRSDLPLPAVNVRLRMPSGRIWEFDFLWRSPRAVLEIDGRHHERPGQAARDRLKDADAEGAGYLVHRMPAAATVDAPSFLGQVGALLRRAAG